VIVYDLIPDRIHINGGLGGPSYGFAPGFFNPDGFTEIRSGALVEGARINPQ
jgi:hypothetical protein